MLVPLVVRLRQDRSDGNAARIRRQFGPPARVESAKYRRGGEGPFQRVEACLRVWGPHKPSCWAAQRRQLRRDLGVVHGPGPGISGGNLKAQRLSVLRMEFKKRQKALTSGPALSGTGCDSIRAPQ